MEADASIWLAIGSALFFAVAVSVVALCRMALRRGDEVEVEITAPSLSLRFHARPSRTGRRRNDEPRGEMPAARTDHLEDE